MMVFKKSIILLVLISVVASTKVRLSCEDKDPYCADLGSDDEVCNDNLSKMVCRKTCKSCGCKDSSSILCKSGKDICNSNAGRLLCERTCNACEFTILDNDEASTSNISISTDNYNNDNSTTSTEDSGSGVGGDPVPAEMEDCLKYHNKFRQQHKGTPPMTWDASLAQDSQQFAEEITKKGELWHDSKENRNGAGENLSSRGKRIENAFKQSTCAHAVHLWYHEMKNFDFNTMKRYRSSPVGHFTQVVWKKSTKLGCGVGRKMIGTMKLEFLVCRYVEAGNVLSKMKENVGDLKDGVFEKMKEEWMNNSW